MVTINTHNVLLELAGRIMQRKQEKSTDKQLEAIVRELRPVVEARQQTLTRQDMGKSRQVKATKAMLTDQQC